MEIYWLEQRQENVPEDDWWLSAFELERLATMCVSKRRNDWRLGRWTAKLALCTWEGLEVAQAALAKHEVRATASGAPQPFTSGKESKLTMSLSHSNGTALCAIAETTMGIGCDLERIEPRSVNFVADYFDDGEQRLVSDAAEDRQLVANLIWSAKESALKALGCGLRECTLAVHVMCEGRPEPWSEHLPWHPFEVRYKNREVLHGVWRRGSSLVRTIVAEGRISRVSELRPSFIGSVADTREHVVWSE